MKRTIRYAFFTQPFLKFLAYKKTNIPGLTYSGKLYKLHLQTLPMYLQNHFRRSNNEQTHNCRFKFIDTTQYKSITIRPSFP